mmetsp:Transcript_18419/g.32814  ORF Transcript_18419/g.32814 Transcript_18419/m.32814 type:complete len:287 (-) Transcript_18419:1846-2706(-)
MGGREAGAVDAHDAFIERHSAQQLHLLLEGTVLRGGGALKRATQQLHRHLTASELSEVHVAKRSASEFKRQVGLYVALVADVEVDGGKVAVRRQPVAVVRPRRVSPSGVHHSEGALHALNARHRLGLTVIQLGFQGRVGASAAGRPRTRKALRPRQLALPPAQLIWMQHPSGRHVLKLCHFDPVSRLLGWANSAGQRERDARHRRRRRRPLHRVRNPREVVESRAALRVTAVTHRRLPPPPADEKRDGSPQNGHHHRRRGRRNGSCQQHGIRRSRLGGQIGRDRGG